MFHFIGIDPGLGGAVAILREDGTCLSCADTPVAIRVDTKGRNRHEYALADLRSLLSVVPTPRLGCLESVHAMPEQGVSSTFALGRGLGIWIGMLAALQIPFMQVYPVTWKTQFGLLRAGKQASRLQAQQRWPNVDLHLKKHDGRADALLLAEYARRKHLSLGRDAAMGAPTVTRKGEPNGDDSAREPEL